MIHVKILSIERYVEYAPGVRGYLQPFEYQISCLNFKKIGDNLLLYGAYDGQATIVFKLDDVSSFKTNEGGSINIYDRDWGTSNTLEFQLRPNEYQTQVHFTTPDKPK